MLQSFDIQAVADVRRFPGSRKFPWFNKDSLAVTLPDVGIEYHHFVHLGGRRRPLKDSHNDAWRLDAFKGYADYMETPEFVEALKQLEKLASLKRTAFMCSEAVWWSCHRSMVSDAALLMEQFGAEAGLEASERAARSRTLGNHIHFARWRQVERLIDVLASDGAVGTIH